MTRLETATQRYIGLSSDEKPTSNVPAGSSFFESDTFRIARWDGYRWAYPPAEGTAEDVQAAILDELRQIRGLLQLMLD